MMRKRNAVPWALVLILASAAIATAHLRVQKSMPEADAILAASPDHVQVWFSQEPDPAISRLTLEGADGEIAIGETAILDDRSLRAMLPSSLAAGDYTVKWRTAGDDGHTQRGDFAFTVLAAD